MFSAFVCACSPCLFVALFLPQLPGVATQPTSPEEHAQNFGIVIEALGELEDGPALETSGLDATALAEGNLQALNDLAGLFGVLCNALLQKPDDAQRPGGSSSAAAVPSATSVRPASAIPASKLTSSTDGLAAADAGEPQDISDPAANASDAAAAANPAGGMGGATAGENNLASSAHAACAAACTGALASTVASQGAAVATKPARPQSARPGTSKPGVHGGLNPAGKKVAAMKTQGKNPSGLQHLHALSQATAQHGPFSSARRGGARPRSAAAKMGVGGGGAAAAAAGGGSSSHLENEISELQQRILARQPEGEATAKLGKLIGNEYGARASSVYSALIKQSLAGVRRAEAIEVSRGMARDMNQRRDARIATIRAQRIGETVERAEQARMARRVAKEELSYRSLYAQALMLERDRLMLQAATEEEARRKTLETTRQRAAAIEKVTGAADAAHHHTSPARLSRLPRKSHPLTHVPLAAP